MSDMQGVPNDVVRVSGPGRGSARAKLFGVAWLLRLLSASYAIWSLVRIVGWWTDADLVIKNLGRFWARDLSALSGSQRMVAMALDLGVWLLLLAAVVCCWKALGLVLKAHAFTHQAVRFLAWGGGLGAASQLAALLMRPVQSWVVTSHLPASEHLLKWAFYPQDLLGLMLCGTILCFACLLTWAVEIADENKAFI